MASKSLEDYLEAIYHSLTKRGTARTNEIAEDLGVKAPSVTEMFDKLKREGYINYEKYEGVTLTEKGKTVAKEVSEVHNNMRKFLEFLEVPPGQADEDACKVEHNLSEKSITQLNKFIDFVESCPREKARWLEHFNYFSEHGELPQQACNESPELNGD